MPKEFLAINCRQRPVPSMIFIIFVLQNLSQYLRESFLFAFLEIILNELEGTT